MMSSVFSVAGIPCWYWTGSILISIYQAYRGFRLQWLFGLGSIHNNAARTAANRPQINLNRGDRVFLLSFADCLTYALCALSGCYTILIAYRVANLSTSEAPIAHPAVFIFLLLYGALGVTGKLPDTLNRIKGPSLE
jgi:hypothetical protein